MFCTLLFNSVNCVFLLLRLCFLLALCMFRSRYSVSLCCSAYSLCVNVSVLMPPRVNPTAVRKYIGYRIPTRQKIHFNCPWYNEFTASLFDDVQTTQCWMVWPTHNKLEKVSEVVVAYLEIYQDTYMKREKEPTNSEKIWVLQPIEKLLYCEIQMLVTMFTTASHWTVRGKWVSVTTAWRVLQYVG